MLSESEWSSSKDSEVLLGLKIEVKRFCRTSLVDWGLMNLIIMLLGCKSEWIKLSRRSICLRQL